MRFRTVLLLAATTLLAAACTDATGSGPTAVDALTAPAAVELPEMIHTPLMIEHAALEPCTASLVDFSGTIHLQRLARALNANRHEIRYSAEPTDVTGIARSGDAAYRVQGAVSGVLTSSGRERIVTVADFRVLVTSPPGVELVRARVAPQLGVLIAFPLAADGQLQDPVIDGVFFAKDECGNIVQPRESLHQPAIRSVEDVATDVAAIEYAATRGGSMLLDPPTRIAPAQALDEWMNTSGADLRRRDISSPLDR